MTSRHDQVLSNGVRHFLDIDRCDRETLRGMLQFAKGFKREARQHRVSPILAGRTLAMVFEKPSTRTRISFEVGMQRLGGNVVVLNETDSQLGRGETIADTARVLSRYVDAIMFRTTDHSKLLELAHFASVPVINGLSDLSHPCQILADVMTYEEHRDSIAGRVVLWSGDPNNVALSWAHAAAQFGFGLRIASPVELRQQSPSDWLGSDGRDVTFWDSAFEAAEGADLIVTDTWFSMGVDEGLARHNLLSPYRVNEELMARAKPEALFMHCLPARRGQEVTEGVIDGPQSVVWDEAENRLHAQGGILTWCMGMNG